MEFTGERFIPGEYDNTPMGVEHWQRYIAAKKIVKGKVVIDIACGEGYGSDLMAKDAAMVYGIDISEETINHASSKYKRDNLNFMCCSMENLNIQDKSVDIIVSFEAIEHVDIEIQKAFLIETKRVLKDDGILIVSSPNKAIATDFAWKVWKYKNEFHVKEFYIEEFHIFLKNYFSNIKFFYQRNEVALIMNSKKANSVELVLSKDKNYDNAQNIIAVCSNSEIDHVMLDSIVLEKSNIYQTNNMIIEDLRQYNLNLKKLYSELEGQHMNIKDANLDLENRYLNIEVVNSELEKQFLNIKSANSELQIKYEELLNEKTELLNENKELLDNKAQLENQNQRLQIKEEELNKIHNSHGWKALKIAYKVKSKIMR